MQYDTRSVGVDYCGTTRFNLHDTDFEFDEMSTIWPNKYTKYSCLCPALVPFLSKCKVPATLENFCNSDLLKDHGKIFEFHEKCLICVKLRRRKTLKNMGKLSNFGLDIHRKVVEFFYQTHDWSYISTWSKRGGQSCQFDNFVLTDGTVSCRNDNLQCHQYQ